MPTNIEIKAVVHQWERTCQLAEALADRPLEVIDQEDTFFNCPQGRLKLRFFSDDRGELISYQRQDQPGAKTSHYLIFPTTEPLLLRDVLAKAWGILGTVKKRRFLYLAGQTRIHLDRVEDLGTYLELEVVLRGKQSMEEGEEIAKRFIKELEIKPGDLVACAYIDLLKENGS